MNRKQRRAAAKLGQTRSNPVKTAATAVLSNADNFVRAGLEHHRAGRLAKAEVAYRGALAAQPTHPDALHLLGVVAHQAGCHDAAVELIRRAIAGNRENPHYFSNLGLALHKLGKLEEAASAYTQAIRIAPHDAEAYANLGNALNEQVKLEEAVAAYAQAIRIRPDLAEAHFNLGVALKQQGRLDEAALAYAQAIHIEPNHVEAHLNRGVVLKEQGRLEEAAVAYREAILIRPDLAEAYSNVGIVLKEQGKLDEAVVAYRRAICIRPHYAQALSNLANALRQEGKLDEAVAACSQAIRLRPDYAEAHSNLGSVLIALNRYQEGLASCDKAIAFKPDDADAQVNHAIALFNLNRLDEALASCERALLLRPDSAAALNARGLILRHLNRLDEALASCDRVIAIKPDHADAHLNRGLIQLLVGRFREGWSDYEWRWEAGNSSNRRPKFARLTNWQGEEVEGRRFLVFSEQGLGDTIQFARYLPLLARKRCQLTFIARAKLARLFRPLTREIEVVTALGSQCKFDFQCALASLPRGFGTDLESIPNAVPYLRAEDSLVARWQQRIGEHGFKVGIAWKVNPQSAHRGRSIPLAQYFGLARIPGVRLISLQKEHGLDQLSGLPEDVRIETLGEDFDNGPDAFIDAAAVMENLDLVITSDTSIAHLAGALGRPAWVALKHVPDWRWLLDREDSPWYPSIRLFRQSQRDNWQRVFSRMEEELSSLVTDRGAGGCSAAPPPGLQIYKAIQ